MHIERMKKRVLYKKMVATLDNFQKTLSEAPISLHFSGHGFRESKESSKLIFEDEKGMSVEVNLGEIKELLKKNENTIEFIFISSCYSEKIGQLFHEAGVKHVICIKDKEPITDETSIAFAKEFYRLAFTQ